MFDIGFTELLLIGIVALIVVGPQRLPGVIRTGLGYVRQIKSGFANVRDEVERELDLNKLKEDLLENKDELKDAVDYDNIQHTLEDVKKASEEFHDIANDGYGYADNFIDSPVHNAEIEADLDHLVQSSQMPMPDANAEASTGVEKINSEQAMAEKIAKKSNKKKKAKKKAKKAAKKEAQKAAKKLAKKLEKAKDKNIKSKQIS